MKLNIKKSLLSQAASRTQGTISDRTLVHIGLNATAGNLQLSVADRVLVIFSSHEAEVETPGTAFVPARLFLDVVRELPEGQVQICTEDAFLTITAGKQNEFFMKLPLIEDKQWREPPLLESNNVASIQCNKLYYVIDQIQQCIAQESARNYGSVGFMHRPDKKHLRMVGTDGFRLSYSEIDMELPENFLDSGVCLSKRALTELQRMCSEGHESICVSISEDKTILSAIAGSYEIYIRLSLVKYPKYQGVLPQDKLTPVKVPRSYFQSVAKRVLLAADKNKALHLNFSEQQLTLKSRTLGCSEGQESIYLEDYYGGERMLSVNGKFLGDVFSTISSDEVILKVNSEKDPIVVVPFVEPLNCHSMHVLVPIRETM